MKVFWSWQSDTPGKTGRFLVRDALLAAIESLKIAPDVEEPDRNELREELHLDADRQGVSGSPDLASTIFKKIEIATVVVADVTPVGESAPQLDKDGRPIATPKKIMNPNVAIELGYALHAISDEKLLMVCNQHYGARDDLPFDLQHKAGPIFYDLAPGASREAIEAARKQLKEAFIIALHPFLKSTERTLREQPAETPSTFCPAAYFTPRETLAHVGEPDVDQVSFRFEAERLCYLRLIPTEPPSVPLQLSKLMGAVPYAPLLVGKNRSAFSTSNRFGAMRYEPGGRSPPNSAGPIKSAVQLFRNGELWAVDASLFVTDRGSWPDRFPIPFIPLLDFERAYYNCLKDALEFVCGHISLDGSWKVVLGVVGLSGTHYGLTSDFLGPIHENKVEHSATIHRQSEGAIEGALLP